MDLVLEGFKDLKEQGERLEFRMGRLEQQSDSFSAALLANSNEIRRLQHDIQVLQHQVAKLTERVEAHEKAHAT